MRDRPPGAAAGRGDLAPARPRLRRVSAAGAVAATALCLPACTADDEIPAGEAVAHYDQVAAGVTASLDSLSGPWELQDSTRTVAADDGACLYSPGTWNAPGPIDGVRGDEGWERVTAAAGPAAESSGFGDFGSPRRSGALTAVEARDGNGAVLRIDDQGRISITGAAVEGDVCTPAALGLD